MFNNFRKVALLSVLTITATSINAQECQPLVWSDEFDGSTLNTSNWEIQIGDGCDQGPGLCGWGNSELQSYQASNLTLSNGVLAITAKKERIKGTKYTSGRIRTANMPASGEWAFGRYEARIKIPGGQGMWPAFWMLPTGPAQTWPTSGEIDIMESTGQQSMMAYGTLHFGQPYPDNRNTGQGIPKQPDRWSNDFHVYTIEWEQNEIRWYIDNILYSKKTPADLAPESWPFDGTNSFHILLNLAVGGTWGGTVDESALPQQMEVDYVRVYAGNQPTISGEHLASPGAVETYSLLNTTGSASWSVTGGTVLSSSSSSANIQWDLASAGSNQSISVDAGSCVVSAPVFVGDILDTETVLENYDGSANMSLVSVTGDYAVAGGILTYTRDAASQYDVIAASTAAIPNAGDFVTGVKAFKMDVINSDPALIGKQILVQLENSAVTTPDNFPGGRHSVYETHVENDNGLQTLQFKLDDRLDINTTDADVDTIVFLIDPNSFNSDVYILDNIEIIGITGGTGNSPPVASFTAACTDLSCTFNGSTSSDNDGSITNYQWDFGDGNSDVGAVVSNTYLTDGNYAVTLTVLDDQAASNVATQQLSVSSGTSGEATTNIVSSVVTGTVSAGRGQKFGTATVTVLDDLGSPAAGVVVSGNFSGTWNESGSAVADSSGIAEFTSSSSASGGVTVNFCVSDVTGGLPLDAPNSSGLCQ
jgi:beta-glucanase (GH16 family)